MWRRVIKLMEALDSYVPLPTREVDKPFMMPIEDVFSISGRGTVVTGRVERGKVKVGEEIEIVGFRPTVKKVVTGVEMFRKLLDAGEAGDNIGVLLRGVEKTDVERGQVLCKPGTILPHTKFKGEVYILSKEEGGRHTPFFNGYRPQFYIRTTDVTGTLKLPEGVEMVMPGDKRPSRANCSRRWRSKRARGSPFAKAAARSARARSLRSSNKASGSRLRAPGIVGALKPACRPEPEARAESQQGSDHERHHRAGVHGL